MKRRPHLPKNLAFAAVLSFLVGASSVHCSASGNGSSNGSGAGSSSGAGAGMTSSTGGASASSTSGGMGGDIGIDVQTADYSQDQFYQNDPPILACDGGGTPPPVTGTPQCPSDKNLPGCICPAAGMTAPCWTGLRVDRDQGDCMDGTTTCTMNSESTLAWGPCNGEVLPVPGATGKAACECFSTGLWQVNNLSPCFFFTSASETTVAAVMATDVTTGQCPAATTSIPPPPAFWSTDSLTVDCAGTFKLCYTIKAGNGASPQATDCVVGQSCVTATYPGTVPVDAMVDNSVPLPDLPGWISSDLACAQQFFNTGGYGQMSVDGQSNQCETVSKTFQQVTYCPLSCNGSDAGMCGSCMPGGGGSFSN